jgi:hypothetical protein
MAPDDDAPTAPVDEEPRAWEVVRAPVAAVLDPARRWESVEWREPSLPRFVREAAVHLEPLDWGAGFLSVTERELPPQLYADLHECTPQAQLRDLHRLVMEFHATPEPVEGSRLVNAWEEAFAEVQRALARDPIPTVERSADALRGELLRRRALLAEPWQPWLRDDEERRSVALWSE